MSLELYRQKRDFKKTKEPKPQLAKAAKAAKAQGFKFVVQKHHASHLHYDFRLELDGVLKSWAVPKGPSPDPTQKRLAVQVEDHPVSYVNFEGEIPAHEYGGGHVIVWDNGKWKPLSKNPTADLEKGRLEFELEGEKLHGKWILVRTRGRASKSWLLMKRSDEFACTGDEADLTQSSPKSVISGRTIEDLENEGAEKALISKPKLRKLAHKSESGLSLKKRTLKKKLKKNPKKNQNTGKENAPSVKTQLKSLKSKQVLKIPEFIPPQLATLTNEPPVGTDWVHEIKYDGYRSLCRLADDRVQLLTRSGLDWTEKYGQLAGECLHMATQNAVIDGEIVCVDEQGRSSFHALQAALKRSQTEKLVYYVFDLLFCDGQDLRDLALVERKKRLAEIVRQSGSKKIIFSEHWETSGKQMLAQSCKLKLEGIISKKVTAPYASGRNDSWMKSKCGHDQEFIIAGYTEPKGVRSYFGALLLAAYDDRGALKYVGKVGTGFNQETITDLYRVMKPHVVDESPFSHRVPQDSKVTWLEPSLVAQIKFAGFTGDGMIRHGSFIDLREDKPAPEVSADRPLRRGTAERRGVARRRAIAERRATSVTLKESSKSVLIGGVKITHPARKIFSRSNDNIRKADLAEFYAELSQPILNYIQDRPLSLLRCPEGTAGECFFQKHLTPSHDESIRTAQVALKARKEKSEQIIYVDSTEGLISLVQMGVIEIHNWGSKRKMIERPDSVVFDLDPDVGVGWTQMMDGAFAIKEMVEKLGLKTFLKVTGGKGLHIHVPIEPRYTWDQAKLFTKTVAANLEAQHPKLYTTQLLKKARTGKIFIDYLRNGYGATAVAPYSVRARPHAPIAVPITWKELKASLRPDQFHLADFKSIFKSRKSDPWKGYSKGHFPVTVLDNYVQEQKKRL